MTTPAALLDELTRAGINIVVRDGKLVIPAADWSRMPRASRELVKEFRQELAALLATRPQLSAEL